MVEALQHRFNGAPKQWQVVHCPGSDCDHMWLLPKQLRRSKASQERGPADRLLVIPMGFQLAYHPSNFGKGPTKTMVTMAQEKASWSSCPCMHSVPGLSIGFQSSPIFSIQEPGSRWDPRSWSFGRHMGFYVAPSEGGDTWLIWTHFIEGLQWSTENHDNMIQ